MILKSKTFEHNFELCDFVNSYKVKVEQICIRYELYCLFYWE